MDEIIDSLFAIKQLNDKHGNIQEVILQNFQPKQDTKMKDEPSADEKYFKLVVALSRIIMPQMNIQIPPNLSPKSYHKSPNPSSLSNPKLHILSPTSNSILKLKV